MQIKVYRVQLPIAIFISSSSAEQAAESAVPIQ